MSKRQKHLYEFGQFTLDASNRMLSRDGQPVPLQPKALDTLLLLVERRDEVLTKDELLQQLWPDSFVEEANLSQNIYVLRKTLGQVEGGNELIRTVPKRGYRFVADVRELRDVEDADLIVEEQTRTHVSVVHEDTNPSWQVARPGALQEPSKPQTSDLSLAGLQRSKIALAFAVLLLCTLGAFTYLRFLRARPTVAPQPHTIAVLPFRRLSPNESDDYLGVGLCDVLITKLSSLRQLVVRPTSAVLKYEKAGTDTIDAGRELRADAVLEGSLQRDGERVRVTVRLLNVADGAPLWAGTFDERFIDMFKVQDSIAEQVAQALVANLDRGDRAVLAKRYTDNPEAYLLYLKGRYFWNKRTAQDIRKSVECFDEAISIDANYALAYTGIADAYWALPLYDPVPVFEALPKARIAAQRALEIDDSLAEAHASMGAVLERLEWNPKGGEAEYRRAIELNPNNVSVHHRLGVLMARVRRFDEAFNSLQRALELDPFSLIVNADLGWTFFVARQYDRAGEQLRKTTDLDPNFGRAHLYLMWYYVSTHRYNEALDELPRVRELGQNSFAAAALEGVAYAQMGKRGEAEHILADLQEQAKRHFVPSGQVARIYIALGEKDQAFESLRMAVEQHDQILLSVKVDPTFEPLRSDPRFKELLARVGLTQ